MGPAHRARPAGFRAGSRRRRDVGGSPCGGGGGGAPGDRVLRPGARKPRPDAAAGPGTRPRGCGARAASGSGASRWVKRRIKLAGWVACGDRPLRLGRSPPHQPPPFPSPRTLCGRGRWATPGPWHARARASDAAGGHRPSRLHDRSAPSATTTWSSRPA